MPGIAATDLTPDLAGFDLAALPGRSAAGRATSPCAIRSAWSTRSSPPTSRRASASTTACRRRWRRSSRHYRGRYYKLKVAGDVEADLERLTRIAAVLDRDAGDYRATLDGNEQYDDVEGIAELWRRMRETPALERLVAADPVHRAADQARAALARPVDAWPPQAADHR